MFSDFLKTDNLLLIATVLSILIIGVIADRLIRRAIAQYSKRRARANFFPFSSSSTIIALKILRKKKRVSIKEYAKIGVTVCTMQLVVTTFYLMTLYLLS